MLNVAYSIAAVIAVIVIVAGIMYVTSDGDSNKINTAKCDHLLFGRFGYYQFGLYNYRYNTKYRQAT